MWIYQSPVGLMKIYFDKSMNRFALEIDNDVYGHFDSAVAAADDVYTFSTGCDEWDSLFEDEELILSMPTDIGEWKKINP